jgi:hypothetical protein
MKTIKTAPAGKKTLVVKSNVRAGAMGGLNHNARKLIVKSNVRAGGLGTTNHNARRLVAKR